MSIGADYEAAIPHRLPILLACVLAFYLIAYFPVKSLTVRHPGHSKLERLWDPLPSFVTRVLFDVWCTVDPAGRDLLRYQMDFIY